MVPRSPPSTDAPYLAVSDSGPRGPRAALSREQLLTDIAARVLPAVPDLPADEFEALVGRMADLELKYRNRLTPTWSTALSTRATNRS